MERSSSSRGNAADKHLAGGVEIRESFGVAVTSNITPDHDTGLGRWTDTEAGVSAATAVSSVLRCRSTSIAVCRTATCIGAGGLPFEGPWGTSFAANPTPDPDTGIGRLTDGQIVAAIHGARRDGTRVLPPMPTTYYTRGIPEADLRAIVAYLRSLEPVRNAVPPPRGVGD